MRYGVEFLELTCQESRNPDEDLVTLNIGDSPLWSGRIRSKSKALIGTIKPLAGEAATLRLWHTEVGERTISCLGRQVVSRDGGAPDAEAAFTRDGAHYTLSYRLVRIQD
ncbi:hypothetical protein [Pseudonocardia sp. TRM90224]|uniref:hypothetical protein n=1 Tax=Pseudonocardia sp. TRM90224 TaxID=2812678 RepID=UPI001E2EA063|nr:hypothetical protein [Pseudonocardia sp. TRM90224]